MKVKNRVALILSLLWIGAIVAVTLMTVFSEDSFAKYSSSSDRVDFSDFTYISDNSHGFGTIHQLSSEGVTKNVYVTRMRAYVGDWKIAKMTSDSVEGQIGGSLYCIMYGTQNSLGYVPYRIASFTENLMTDTMSYTFYMKNGLLVTGISLDEEDIYITGISSTRQDVYIYRFPKSEMIKIEGISTSNKETLAGHSAEIKDVKSFRSPDGRIFADAEYVSGDLYTRMTDQAMDDYFAMDLEAKEIFDNRTEDFFSRVKAVGISIIYIIAACLIGTAIIFIVAHLIVHRRWVVYRIITAETLLLVCCGMFFWFSAESALNAARREFVRNEMYTLQLIGSEAPVNIGAEEFYSTSQFATLYSNMREVADMSDALADIFDVCVVDSISGQIIVSIDGKSQSSVDYAYGSKAAELAVSSKTREDADVTMDGRKAVIISVEISNLPQYRFLCLAHILDPLQYVAQYDLMLVIFVLVVFVVLSLIITLMMLADNRVLSSMSAALEKLGNGDEKIKMPKRNLGYDMNRMWASINEICKNIRRVSRDKFLTYEAYFRFAPKRIEDIMGKDSITEVKTGDRKELSGTLALVMTGSSNVLNEHDMEEKNKFIELAERNSDSTNGIFLSIESNLSVMRLFFFESNNNTIRFGTDLCRDAATDGGGLRPAVIMHYSNYVYGVVGTDTYAATFLSQEDQQELLTYGHWLGSLGVSLVVTESVKEREKGAWDYRYIGFIFTSSAPGKKRINLYEVLDASDSESRRGKKKLRDVFDKALKLFYERDFYFARNAFTDIIREVPSDSIAKWYLFECERLLNEVASEDFAGELHADVLN